LASRSRFPWLLIIWCKRRITVSSWYFCTTDVWKTFFVQNRTFELYVPSLFFDVYVVDNLGNGSLHFYFLPWFISCSFTSGGIQFKVFDSNFSSNIIKSLGFLQGKSNISQIIHINSLRLEHFNYFSKKSSDRLHWQSSHFCLFKSKCVSFFSWGQFLFIISSRCNNIAKKYIGTRRGLGKGKNMSTNTVLLGASIFFCLLDL